MDQKLLVVAGVGGALGLLALLFKGKGGTSTPTADTTGTATAYSSGGMIYVPTTQTDYYFNSGNTTTTSTSTSTTTNVLGPTQSQTPAPAPVVPTPTHSAVPTATTPAPITGQQLNSSGVGSHPVTITSVPTNTLTTGPGGNWQSATAANPKNTAIKQPDGTYMLYDQYGVPMDVPASTVKALGF